MSGHQREGFLHQKLVEPRSYDYNRILAWDDRARMPQFRFARSHKRSGETEEAFEARMCRSEEAEAREAVMTFILGLVAEPVPVKSINQPTGDRLAEVKGRQVLDKFNCAGCHQIRPGFFDVKVTAEGLKLLDENFQAATYDKSFHNFPKHYNWAGKNPECPGSALGPGALQLRKFLLPDSKGRRGGRDTRAVPAWCTPCVFRAPRP